MQKCNLVEIKDLSKSFKKNKVLDLICYTFEPGKIYCIKGKNGAGKSTLFKIMMGFMNYDNGSILTNSCHISGIIEESCGYNYFTVLEHLTFLLGRDEDTKNKINKLAEMFDFSNKLNEKFGKLSMGMKQKVALIYAFIVDCDYLLLDEPTTSLDSLSCVVLKNLINDKIKSGKSVIISSHDSYFIKTLNGINLLLEDGKLNLLNELVDNISVSLCCKNTDFKLFLEDNNLKYDYIKGYYNFECNDDFIHKLIDVKEQYEIQNISFSNGGEYYEK